MTTNMDLKIHNRFDIDVVDVNTGEIKQKATAYNVICTNTFSSGVLSFAQVCYGSGIGTPSESDTALFNGISTLSASEYSKSLDIENGLFYLTKKAVIESSASVGSTITEVGIGRLNYLYTHALLQDQNGNPISIVKTSTDVINIYATVYLHFTQRPNGLYHTYLNSTRGNYIIPIFTFLFGMCQGQTSSYKEDNVVFYFHNSQRYGNTNELIPASYYHRTNCGWLGGLYSSTNKKYTISCPRIEAASGNGSDCGFRYVSVSRGYFDTLYPSSIGETYHEVQFIGRVGDSWFQYSQLNNETVATGDGTTTDFKLKFMYPHDVTVKVDGVIRSDVTIDYAPPHTDLSDYVDLLSPSATASNLLPRKYSDTTQLIMRNPAHVVGVASFTANAGTVSASDDLTTWTDIGTMSSAGTFTVPSGSEHYTYYRFNRGLTETITVTAKSTYTGYNLHFATAPANNSVITASYKADCIAKDTDHVFDFKMEITLAEYTQ